MYACLLCPRTVCTEKTLVIWIFQKNAPTGHVLRPGFLLLLQTNNFAI